MKTTSLFLFLLILFSCKRETKRYAGICLSFDDRAVGDWYSIRGVLKEHEARVTFFVTQFDSLNSSEIGMLKELEKDGHEIGSHGALHINARDYILSHSYGEYIRNEVDPGISAMRKAGFEPKSFAYPFGTRFLFTDFLLSRKFKVLRGVAGITPGQDITSIDEVYYDFDNDRTVFALGIDQNAGVSAEMILQAMKRAKDKKEVLLLYGHSPINITLLKFILTEAGKSNLKFFTMTDLAD